MNYIDIKENYCYKGNTYNCVGIHSKMIMRVHVEHDMNRIIKDLKWAQFISLFRKRVLSFNYK